MERRRRNGSRLADHAGARLAGARRPRRRRQALAAVVERRAPLACHAARRRGPRSGLPVRQPARRRECPPGRSRDQQSRAPWLRQLWRRHGGLCGDRVAGAPRNVGAPGAGSASLAGRGWRQPRGLARVFPEHEPRPLGVHGRLSPHARRPRRVLRGGPAVPSLDAGWRCRLDVCDVRTHRRRAGRRRCRGDAAVPSAGRFLSAA